MRGARPRTRASRSKIYDNLLVVCRKHEQGLSLNSAPCGECARHPTTKCALARMLMTSLRIQHNPCLGPGLHLDLTRFSRAAAVWCGKPRALGGIAGWCDDE